MCCYASLLLADERSVRSRGHGMRSAAPETYSPRQSLNLLSARTTAGVIDETEVDRRVAGPQCQHRRFSRPLGAELTGTVGDRRSARWRGQPPIDRRLRLRLGPRQCRDGAEFRRHFRFDLTELCDQRSHVVAEFTANAPNQSFGIWFGTDTSSIATFNILLGGAVAHDFVGIGIAAGQLTIGTGGAPCPGQPYNCGTFNDARITPDAGFFFRPTGSGTTYYSLDQLNAPDPFRTDRVIALQDGTTSNWLFSYEDGTDFDAHNDMAVKVESITAVPEPENVRLDARRPGCHGLRRAASQIPLRALGACSRRRPDHERTSVRSFYLRLRPVPEFPGVTRAGDRARRPR